jgi:DNA polymerase-3 subunit alpha
LFQRGETSGIFQFESVGMQKHLKSLVPDKFEDLIAMNALYRPGPMEYIKNYVDRKHGREDITYDLPEMEEFLNDTYGITVYQEQVMLLSQKLAGFSKGQADYLRKAMGKKLIDEMAKLYTVFIDGGKANGHSEEKLDKIWKDWEAFASYAFNKSHSTCYAYIAFQTAYLKAHYPAEFMASVLNHNKNDVVKLTAFMAECKKQGIQVLGASVNESGQEFKVTDDKVIRFGLSGIKGVGDGPANEIIAERTENGKFIDIFDICERVNLRAINKRVLDALASCGAFDEFGVDRSCYVTGDQQTTGNELAIKHGGAIQANKAKGQISLFGEDSGVKLSKPKLPSQEPWPESMKLAKEKELLGLYTSGHPLDDYQFLINFACNHSLSDFENNIVKNSEEICIAGFVSSLRQIVTKSGSPMMIFTLEDFTGGMEFVLNGKNFSEFAKYIVSGAKIAIKGRTRPHYREPDKLSVDIKSIQYLDDFEKQAFKTITINLNPEELTENVLEEIVSLTSNQKGGLKLRIELKGHKKPIKLVSRNYTVKLDNETKEKMLDLPLNFSLS